MVYYATKRRESEGQSNPSNLRVRELSKYSVKYIRRDGHSDSVSIKAGSKGEAKKIAEERGYEDILGVNRAEFTFTPIAVAALVVVLALVLLLI